MKKFIFLKRIICQSFDNHLTIKLQTSNNHYFKIGCDSQSNYNYLILDLTIFKS